MRWKQALGWVACAAIVVACGGSHGGASPADGPQDDGGSLADSASDDGATSTDGSNLGKDAAADTTPTGDASRGACTTTFTGTALTANVHGRMDGYLYAIVPAGGSHSCRGDSGHVHLQVKMSGAIYDVAVNTDTYVAQKDANLPDGAWAEGWHAGARLDYPTDLGLHSGDFPATTPGALQATVGAALANTNEISVFAVPYDPTGAHDVHRKPSGYDGAIVTNPLASPAHILAFRFMQDSF